MSLLCDEKRSSAHIPIPTTRRVMGETSTPLNRTTLIARSGISLPDCMHALTELSGQNPRWRLRAPPTGAFWSLN